MPLQWTQGFVAFCCSSLKPQWPGQGLIMEQVRTCVNRSLRAMKELLVIATMPSPSALSSLDTLEIHVFAWHAGRKASRGRPGLEGREEALRQLTRNLFRVWDLHLCCLLRDTPPGRDQCHLVISHGSGKTPEGPACLLGPGRHFPQSPARESSVR